MSYQPVNTRDNQFLSTDGVSRSSESSVGEENAEIDLSIYLSVPSDTLCFVTMWQLCYHSLRERRSFNLFLHICNPQLLLL